MASERGRDTRRVGTKTNSSSSAPLVEEIVPSSGWTEDNSGHLLLVDLPEFSKEDVKLQVDGSTRRIIVKGERQTNQQKRVHFDLTFPVPADSDIDNITGQFDSEILYVYVPKRTKQDEHRVSEPNKASNGNVERPEEIESEDHNNVVNKEGNDHAPHHQEDRETRNQSSQYVDRFSRELSRKWERKQDIARALVKVLMQNKGVVITAVMAFSFGLYISHKFHSWNAS